MLWHHDNLEWVSMDYRSWTQWRGYSTVTTTKGAAGGPQTVTTGLYYRGMNGDRTSAGWNTRTETLTDSQNSGLADPDPLAGHLREQTRLDGAAVQSSTITAPTVAQTASRAAVNTFTVPVVAYMVTDTDEKTRTWLAASSSWRWTETQTAYNSYKLRTVVTDLNDTSTGTDDTCTTTTYVTPDTTNWLIDYPAKEVTTDCAATPGDGDYQSGSQTFYDASGTLGATPTLGLPTTTQDLASVSGGVFTWKQNSRTEYDPNGRVTAAYDALDHKTSTAYTPASGAPVTSTTETNPAGWTTTTTVDPGHGSALSDSDVNAKTTTAQYDPLGRLSKVFSPHTSGVTGYAASVAARPFTDIIDTGTAVALTGDESHTQISLPFAFGFYGQSYSSAWLSTNGFLTFTDPGTDPAPGPLPSTTAPNAGIYPFWDDLQLDAYSNVATQTTGTASNRQFTIEYYHAYLYGRSTLVSFQITLNESGGGIQFNYADLDNPDDQGSAASVGVENADGTQGTQYSYKQPILADDQAITFSPTTTPTTSTPDLQYTYTLSNTAPNTVQTQKLGPTGAQIASYAIYDGQFRLRQNQDPTPVSNGGRWIIDTTYDSRGLKAKNSSFFNNTSGPSGSLGTFTDSVVPTQDVYTYDNLERQTVDAFYTNGVAQWQSSNVYDGDREAEIPPAGGVVDQKILDARGNTTELRQYAGTSLTGTYQATDYTYDRDNKLVKTVDSVGNTWTWVYDLRGRETSRTDPDSGTTASSYDDADNLLTTTDNKNVTLAYTYDSLNRKTSQWHGSTSAPGYQLASWTYDTLAKGQLTSARRWHSTDQYITGVTGYDDHYRPLGETATIPAGAGTALAGTWTTTSSYNLDGTLASTTYPAVGGLGAETVTNTYDANGYQLTSAGLDTYLSATSYQPWGDAYQRTLGSGNTRVQVTTDEDPATHRASTLTTATEHPGTPGSFDEQYTQKYNWTNGGTVASVDTQHAGATTDSQCFTYDYLQRLTTAFTTTPGQGGCAATPSTSTVGGPDAYWHTYSYDSTGNRTGLVEHGLSGAADTTVGYTYPAPGAVRAHTLSSTTTTGPGAGSSSYTYDLNGNQSNSTMNGLSTDSSWDDLNHLKTTTVHATGGDQTSAYVYDADETELMRISPTSTTLYLGDTEITTNTGGAAVATATRYYTTGDTVIASRNTPGTLTWLANDDQNTADVAVDQTTLAVTVRKQDPYGNPRGSPTTWPNSRGFVGGTTEPGGLEHLGARLYDPSTGRFISDDTVTDTDNPQQLNGYTYAYDSPLTYSDPTGLWGWHNFFKAVANVASVASIIPGPIGMIAGGVAAVSYAAAGDWKDAAISAAGALLDVVGGGAIAFAAKVAVGAKVAHFGAAVLKAAPKFKKFAPMMAVAGKVVRTTRPTWRNKTVRDVFARAAKGNHSVCSTCGKIIGGKVLHGGTWVRDWHIDHIYKVRKLVQRTWRSRKAFIDAYHHPTNLRARCIECNVRDQR